jgi:type I restriction enzyme S subunit
LSSVYLKYFLQSNIGQTQVRVLQTGGNREGLSAAAIKAFSIVKLPLSEQQSIANYLDQKCKEIDELISVKKEKIEKLKAYKKSVIYEYVTGKKQVN